MAKEESNSEVLELKDQIKHLEKEKEELEAQMEEGE